MWSGIHRLADRKKLTVQDLYGENLLLMHRNCKKFLSALQKVL